MIDPEDDEFDFETSKFSLPGQSLLTAEKELLNGKRDSLGLPNRNVELFEELESDLVASVLLQALARAKELENSWDRITESCVLPSEYSSFADWWKLVLADKGLATKKSEILAPWQGYTLWHGYAYCLFGSYLPDLNRLDRSLISSIDG